MVNLCNHADPCISGRSSSADNQDEVQCGNHFRDNKEPASLAYQAFTILQILLMEKDSGGTFVLTVSETRQKDRVEVRFASLPIQSFNPRQRAYVYCNYNPIQTSRVSASVLDSPDQVVHDNYAPACLSDALQDCSPVVHSHLYDIGTMAIYGAKNV